MSCTCKHGYPVIPGTSLKSLTLQCWRYLVDIVTLYRYPVIPRLHCRHRHIVNFVAILCRNGNPVVPCLLCRHPDLDDIVFILCPHLYPMVYIVYILDITIWITWCWYCAVPCHILFKSSESHNNDDDSFFQYLPGI